MAANVFEIISVSGSAGYEAEFDYLDSSFNFEEYVSLSASASDTNVVPLGWTSSNFSNLDGMGGGVTLTQLLNNDFGASGGSSWVFETNDTLTDNTLHSSFAKLPGWTIRMFSVDNDGMQHDTLALLEDSTSPGFGYAKGNERRLIPTLNFVGATTDTTPNVSVSSRVGNHLTAQYVPLSLIHI